MLRLCLSKRGVFYYCAIVLTLRKNKIKLLLTVTDTQTHTGFYTSFYVFWDPGLASAGCEIIEILNSKSITDDESF